MNKRFKQFVYTQVKDYVEFSELMECSVQKIKNLGSGKQKVTIDLALELEKKFNLNPCWLVFNQGEMYHPSMKLGVDEMSEDETQAQIQKIKKDIEDMKKLLTK